MARILITSGPTRQYLDPVRYLPTPPAGGWAGPWPPPPSRPDTKWSSLAGPSPSAIRRRRKSSRSSPPRKCWKRASGFSGLRRADRRRRPLRLPAADGGEQKIRKTGRPLEVELIETPDIVARLGKIRRAQWMVAFALETEDRHLRALQKLEQKNCDLIVVNGPAAKSARPDAGPRARRRRERVGGPPGRQDAGSPRDSRRHSAAADGLMPGGSAGRPMRDADAAAAGVENHFEGLLLIARRTRSGQAIPAAVHSGHGNVAG